MSQNIIYFCLNVKFIICCYATVTAVSKSSCDDTVEVEIASDENTSVGVTSDKSASNKGTVADSKVADAATESDCVAKEVKGSEERSTNSSKSLNSADEKNHKKTGLEPSKETPKGAAV